VDRVDVILADALVREVLAEVDLVEAREVERAGQQLVEQRRGRDRDLAARVDVDVVEVLASQVTAPTRASAGRSLWRAGSARAAKGEVIVLW